MDGIVDLDSMMVIVNGAQLYYEKMGSGPDMILLHGNGEDHTIFSGVTMYLKDHFTLWLVDLRGHGRSMPTCNYHYDDMAEDIHRFIRKMGIDRPALVGFSDGGIIGLILASMHSNLLSHLFVAGANTNPSTLKGFGMYMTRVRNRRYPDPKVTMMLTEPDITEDDLSKIDVPTVVIAGSRDCVDPSDTEFIASSIPDAKKVIMKGENHSSYIKNGGLLAQVILSEYGLVDYQKDVTR